MDEYIKRKDAFEILQSRLDSISQMSYFNMDWHELDIMRNAIENAIDDVREVPSANVQPIDFVQNEVLNYLFNKECEAENMPYSDVRQERITTLREVIRYVEGIGDVNG
jgi:hypothetical protein